MESTSTRSRPRSPVTTTGVEVQVQFSARRELGVARSANAWIVAGLVVLFAPEFGGYLVAAWLGGIIVNLVTADPMRFYDVALRDFGLLLAALALARLAAGVRQGTS